MTTLFRPVEITSAEQAEQMPIGTVAYDEARMHGPLLKEADDYWFGDRSKDNEEVADFGYTALVPVEAEEETRPASAYLGQLTTYSTPDGVAYGAEFNDRTGETVSWEHRLVTPWEDA